MAIYVITHKPVERPAEKGYRLIQAGSYRGHIPGMIHDDSGENISEKNDFYCELTALYWIWKNAPDKYIGICHYRRLFSNRWDSSGILSRKDAVRLLKRYDIILPQIAFLRQSVWKEYCEKDGYAEDLECLRNVIAKRDPGYLGDFDSYFHGRTTCFLNMMICRRELFDAYCSWVFPVLKELEGHIDMSVREGNQRRIYGYLSERLLNVWVRHNRLRHGHVFIVERERELSRTMQLVYAGARFGIYRTELVRGVLSSPGGKTSGNVKTSAGRAAWETAGRPKDDSSGPYRGKTIEVYTATTQYLQKLPDYCIPVEVGSALRGDNEHTKGCIRDDKGDSISEKNGSYCELTAVYWAWKNSRADIKGLCHYRRFFSASDSPRLYPIGMIRESEIPESALSKEEILKTFEQYDIILPMPYAPCPATVREDLEKYVCRDDIAVLEKILEAQEDQSFCTSWKELQGEKFLSYFNMMIAPADLFDSYCAWLFPILEEVEKRIDISGYDRQHQRIFGYLSEVLLNVWVRANALNVRYFNVDQILEYSAKDPSERRRNSAYAALQKMAEHQPLQSLYRTYCRQRYPELYRHYF